MSAVLNQTKQLYRQALGLQSFIFLFITFGVAICGDVQTILSILFGQIAGFVPHCIFVFWVFFRANAKKQPKITAFYRGEGLKWLSAICLMTAVLLGYQEINHLVFFAGYLLALGANSIVPIILKLNVN